MTATAAYRALTHPNRPSRPSTFSSGQNPVKLDCSRFAPTNPVNRYHHGDTNQPSTSERMTNAPAKRRMTDSLHMGRSSDERVGWKDGAARRADLGVAPVR